MARGGAACGQEREHILLLLARGMSHRHQPFGEQVAALALGAERALAPEHEGAQLPLGVVVGRLDVLAVDEGPQRGAVLEDVRARARNLRELGRDRALERGLDLLAQRGHLLAELVAAQPAGFEVAPVREHDGEVVQQLPAERRCPSGAL